MTTSKLDAIADRLEARRALPCEVCDDGEECACCAVDREFADVIAVVREVAAANDRYVRGQTSGVALSIDIHTALAPLTEGETDRG